MKINFDTLLNNIANYIRPNLSRFEIERGICLFEPECYNNNFYERLGSFGFRYFFSKSKKDPESFFNLDISNLEISKLVLNEYIKSQ